MYKKHDKSIYLSHFYDSFVLFAKKDYEMYKYVNSFCYHEGWYPCILDIPAGKQIEDIFTLQSSKGLRPVRSEYV
jgi:hypothetical protein